MKTTTIRRRSFVLAACCATLPLAAQVLNLNDAVNKAGRQRMLSQRMSKAYLALLANLDNNQAHNVLDRSMALFDRQLTELKGFAPNPTVQDTYQQLDQAWSEFKLLLVGAVPSRSGALKVLQSDAKVLALANQGTLQYEQSSGKPSAQLVNIAGRQRMLSQRMAKFYLASSLQLEQSMAASELEKSRREFVTALETLRQAPQATDKIRADLALADGQWVFFNQALNQTKTGADPTKAASDVFISSENLLSIMDDVTGLYANLKL